METIMKIMCLLRRGKSIQLMRKWQYFKFYLLNFPFNWLNKAYLTIRISYRLCQTVTLGLQHLVIQFTWMVFIMAVEVQATEPVYQTKWTSRSAVRTAIKRMPSMQNLEYFKLIRNDQVTISYTTSMHIDFTIEPL